MEMSVSACEKILMDAGINPASTIEYRINDEMRTVSLTWIIESFLRASEETKVLFVSSLTKIAATKNHLALKEYFENMGKLLILSAHSQTLPEA